MTLGQALMETLRAYIAQLAAQSSQRRLAARTGIPVADVNNIIGSKRKRRVTTAQLARIADGLELAPSQLFFELARIATRIEQAQEPRPAVPATE